MRNFIVSALTVLLLLLIAGCDPVTPATEPYSDPTVTTLPPVPLQIPKPTTYNEAISIAGQYNRPLFLVFSAMWCSPCKKMKLDVWPDERVKEALKDYVVYMVDVDRERKVTESMRIRTIPAYGIFDASSGKAEPVRVAIGERDIDELIDWLCQNNPTS